MACCLETNNLVYLLSKIGFLSGQLIKQLRSEDSPTGVSMFSPLSDSSPRTHSSSENELEDLRITLQHMLRILQTSFCSTITDGIELLKISLRLLDTGYFKQHVFMEKYTEQNEQFVLKMFESIFIELKNETPYLESEKVLQCLQNSDLVGENAANWFENVRLFAAGDLAFTSTKNSPVSKTQSDQAKKKQKLEVGKRITEKGRNQELLLSHSKSLLFKPSSSEELETEVHENEKDEKQVEKKGP